MSTGHFSFSLLGSTVDGEFENGVLISGKLITNNIIYSGAFNRFGVLHGNNCSMTFDTHCYTGIFENGKLLSGNFAIDGKIMEYGTYIDIDNSPHLKSGKKQVGNIIHEGTFDLNGNLVSGRLITPNGIIEK